jgi:hypothetical protein
MAGVFRKVPEEGPLSEWPELDALLQRRAEEMVEGTYDKNDTGLPAQP